MVFPQLDTLEELQKNGFISIKYPSLYFPSLLEDDGTTGNSMESSAEIQIEPKPLLMIAYRYNISISTLMLWKQYMEHFQADSFNSSANETGSSYVSWLTVGVFVEMLSVAKDEWSHQMPLKFNDDIYLFWMGNILREAIQSAPCWFFSKYKIRPSIASNVFKAPRKYHPHYPDLFCQSIKSHYLLWSLLLIPQSRWQLESKTDPGPLFETSKEEWQVWLKIHYDVTRRNGRFLAHSLVDFIIENTPTKNSFPIVMTALECLCLFFTNSTAADQICFTSCNNLLELPISLEKLSTQNNIIQIELIESSTTHLGIFWIVIATANELLFVRRSFRTHLDKDSWIFLVSDNFFTVYIIFESSPNKSLKMTLKLSDF